MGVAQYSAFGVEHLFPLPDIRPSRERLGWSQRRLAKEAGVALRTVQNAEHGQGVTLNTLGKIVLALAAAKRAVEAKAAKDLATAQSKGREALVHVTPYESNADYRELIDALEAMPEADRIELMRFALWTAERVRGPVAAVGEPVSLDNVINFPSYSDADGDFPFPPIPEEQWIERDTDIPRPLHAWIRPVDAEAAAGPPRNPDDVIIPAAQLLNSLREVRDDRVKVVKVFGDSMYPVLRNGWKVLLDPARSLFQPGKIVMVYLRDEGTTIGLLAKQGESFKIVKRNPNYGGPVEIPLTAGEWYPIGTVTTIVEAPVEIE